MRKYIRQHIYRWHRITSLIVAIPVLLWTLSGFLHPVVNAFKPQVNNQTLPVKAVDTSKIKISLQEALAKHRISRLHKFRIVEVNGSPYYQLHFLDRDTLAYISCYNGQLLLNGDLQYAADLAQRYLTDPNKTGRQEDHHGGVAADLSSLVRRHPMSDHKKYNITDVQLVTAFSGEYKKSNVLLPVFRVQFDRDDHIRLYVETATGRLATAVDDRKALFTKFFSFAHSWSFLNGLGSTKQILLGAFSLLCFVSSLLGFYVYNITRNKNGAAHKTRSSHRLLGNVFVLTTLLYAFSGAWHSFHKLGQQNISLSDRSEFCANELGLPLQQLMLKLQADEKLTDISVVKIKSNNYWQLFTLQGKQKQRKYFDSKSLQELKDGDLVYGAYLASLFSGRGLEQVSHQQILYKFSNRYSMMKKRLPVVETSFGGKENYYVETGTGTLAAVTGPVDQAERFSFSNLHMHHYWEDWLGKTKGKPVKNLVLIGTTGGLLLLALTGLLLYRRKMMKKRYGPANY